MSAGALKASALLTAITVTVVSTLALVPPSPSVRRRARCGYPAGLTSFGCQ
ncbi:MAG: hypothetical protein R2873_10300 [Caldilineaceae bacterium]